MIIPHNWDVPPEIRKRVGTTTYGRQRAIFEKGHLLLILHRVPKPDEKDREGVLFWREPDGTWHSKSGGGIGALKRHITEYIETAATLEKAHDSAPDSKALFEVLDAVTPVRRAANNMFAAVQSARQSLDNAEGLIEARDLAADADRILELLQSDVRNAIDYRIARDSEEQNRIGQEAVRASHRLNVLAAIFFPLMALSSVFGMNMPSGLEHYGSQVFWGIFTAGLLLGYFIKGWVTHRG